MLAQILYYLKSASGVLTAAGVFFWKNTPGLKKKPARQDSAAGFGPEIQFPHLSLAFSLILSGVSQIEVSFGKKQNAKTTPNKQ